MSAFEYLAYACQGVLGIVFLAAAVSKTRRPARFAAAVRGYELLPAAIVPPVAAVVIAAEWTLAWALLTASALDLAAPAAVVLLLAFGVAVGVNLRRDKSVPCGCFGSSTETITGRTLGRIGLLASGAAVFELVRRVADVPALNLAALVTEGAAGMEELSVIAGLGALLVVVALWTLHVGEIRAVLRRPSKAT